MIKFINIDRKLNLQNFIFWGFLAAYFIYLLYLCNKLYIWEDEAYSLNTSSHSLPNVLRLSYDFEGQPPFYFMLLAIWRLINSSIFYARILSIIFIGISALFFHRLVSLISVKENSLWMVVIFLLNPVTVWAALEIRLYALVILLSIIATYYFFKFYIENKNKYLYNLLIISLIGLYTQYFFAFLIVSFAISLWIFKGWKITLKFCLYFIPIILLFLPNFIFLPDQLSMAKSHMSSHSLTRRILTIVIAPQDFILSLNMLPGKTLWRWIIKIPFAILFIYAYYKILKRHNTEQNQYLKYLNIIILSILLLTLQFIFVITSFSLIYQNKYMLITFSLIILLFSVFYVFSPFRRNMIYTIVSFYFISLLALTYKHPTKTYDFKEVANFITIIKRNQEPILFYGKSTIPPFQYYYKDKNELIGIPRLKYDKNYYEDNINDTTDLSNLIKKVFTPTKSYLLVLGSIGGFKYDDSMNPQMIQQCLERQYNITLDSTFKSKNSNNSLRIQRLEIKEDK